MIYIIMQKFGWASPDIMRGMYIPQILWLNEMMKWQADIEEKERKKMKSKRRR